MVGTNLRDVRTSLEIEEETEKGGWSLGENV